MALTLEGFDQHLAARHGLDGLYIYEHCHNGQPLYVRRPTRDRHLWYSSQYWDWNVSPGARGGNEQAVHVFSSSRGMDGVHCLMCRSPLHHKLEEKSSYFLVHRAF